MRSNSAEQLVFRDHHTGSGRTTEERRVDLRVTARFEGRSKLGPRATDDLADGTGSVLAAHKEDGHGSNCEGDFPLTDSHDQRNGTGQRAIFRMKPKVNWFFIHFPNQHS